MSKKLYISDLHFGHENIIKFDGRPFKNVEEMEDALVERWNSVVGNGDTVYILGDFCWSAKTSEWVRLCNRLKGSKQLILGNHDVPRLREEARNKFTDIKDFKEIMDGSRTVIMSHYPMPFYRHDYSKNVYMMYGHVHCTKEDDAINSIRESLWRVYDESKVCNRGNLINVGCMKYYMDYTPRTLDYLIKVLEKERKTYLEAIGE